MHTSGLVTTAKALQHHDSLHALELRRRLGHDLELLLATKSLHWTQALMDHQTAPHTQDTHTQRTCGVNTTRDAHRQGRAGVPVVVRGEGTLGLLGEPLENPIEGLFPLGHFNWEKREREREARNVA